MANEDYGWKPDDQISFGQSDINFHVKKRKQNGPVIALSVLCAVLLLIVGVGALYVSLQGVAIVPGSDGRIAIVIGKNDGGSPFDVVQNGPNNIEGTTLTASIKLEDPPPLTTSPVESNGSLSTREIAAKVRPSVVGILVSDRYSSGLGSGIIMTENGLIITNHHVIDGATNITVVLESGERYTATVVGSDEQSDLAVIRIEAENLPAATFGNSDAMQVGDRAIAIGTPFDLSLMGTTTQGIISAINRDIVYDNRIMTLIQTDATINPGNSGGPLVNEYGQVIGINSMKIGQQFEGLGFAIPMNTAKEIIEELITHGRVTGKPALGISGRMLNAATAAANNVPLGLYVSEVYPVSNAYKNIRPGDIITKINGEDITDMPTFNKLKNQHKAGDTIKLTIYRDINFYDDLPGVTLEINVTLIDEDLLTEQ
jgi:serine protease Do